MTRVLHISPTDIEGGAPRGAYNLHKALQRAGADSQMLVARKYSDDPLVHADTGLLAVIREALRDKLDRWPLKLHTWTHENWWTVGWLPYDIRPAVDALQPDVVHFHWAGRGCAPIATLDSLRAYPLVWTLRDMWPLTGGCHYSGGCQRYLTGCGACPQLSSSRSFDLSRWQWRRKHRHWQGVTVTYIALSQWMADLARQSPLVFGNEVSLIPNGIDVERFHPVEQAVAREMWQLPLDRKVIMFGALQSTSDPRKGFKYLSAALRRLVDQGWGEKALAVVFGASSGDLDCGLEVRYMGRINDDISLAVLYSAADVMVVPSIEENLGKTAVEAMACGVPVAAFANTGQLDIVDHRINGYLAENLSAPDLANGVEWCLRHGEADPDLRQRARTKAVGRFDIRAVAERHISLYGRLQQARAHAAAVPDIRTSMQT